MDFINGKQFHPLGTLGVVGGNLRVKRFRDAVMMIKGLGISLLLAESNLTSAAAIADRLYVIDRGEIIFQGTPQDALANDAVMRALRG